MIRYFLGLLLVQIATVSLVLLTPDLLGSEVKGVAWLRLFIPLLVVTFFATFWFASFSKQSMKDELNAVTTEHLREKEKIQLNAERAKTRLVKKTQQQIAKESKSAHSRANFKVGAAFAGTMGFGALMVITELLTLGLLTMTTAGGALGGYLLRAKKESNFSLPLKSKKSIKVIKQNDGQSKITDNNKEETTT